MTKPFKRANILFLQGVYPSQLETIEEEFGNRLIEEAEQYDDVYAVTETFDAIPPVFRSVEQWPKSTNILCWACTNEFPTRPYFIPERIKNHKDGGIEMITHGIFCSASCAVRYLNTEFGEVGSVSSNKLSKWDAYYGVRMLHRIFTGKQVEKIAPSPPRTLMKQFGGDMSKAQFRELCATYDSSHNLNNFTMNDYST